MKNNIVKVLLLRNNAKRAAGCYDNRVRADPAKMRWRIPVFFIGRPKMSIYIQECPYMPFRYAVHSVSEAEYMTKNKYPEEGGDKNEI
ncbi:MAG TPA: hypothetical protein DCM49_02960 [Lachnospiraceae bacterium]|nr:hypothetical protein [Lachnospiraceae bacterium]